MRNKLLNRNINVLVAGLFINDVDVVGGRDLHLSLRGLEVALERLDAPDVKPGLRTGLRNIRTAYNSVGTRQVNQ